MLIVDRSSTATRGLELGFHKKTILSFRAATLAAIVGCANIDARHVVVCCVKRLAARVAARARQTRAIRTIATEERTVWTATQAVSYTLLRALVNVLAFVCRLFLDKKKK